MKTKNALFVAGGTGGHINAAIAVGEMFQEKGYHVRYLTGKRPLDYKLFAGQNVDHLEASPLRYKNPFKLISGFLKNLQTFIKIFFQIKKIKPQFILGAGGYVCGPTLLAGYLQGVPIYIVEQNSVMGLTNKILGNISKKIFVHFKQTKGLAKKHQHKVVVSGNPIRNKIAAYSFSLKPVSGNLNLLVFGGSLGASEINNLIGELIKKDFPFKLSIHHQTGMDHKVDDKNLGQNINYDQKKYIDNMAEEYSWCDVILARAGASTISELRVVGKPVVLIPYPLATDNHQYYNAQLLKEEVEFPVFIHTAKELAENSTQKLTQLLLQQYEWAKNPPQNRPYHDKSTMAVMEEILRDVQ